MGLVLSAEPGLFQVGDAVTIRPDEVEHHHRTPWFIKGKVGVVRAISGPFLNPESRAHGGDGIPRRLLYQVEFDPEQIWGNRYGEGAGDLLLVDVYEQWLEPKE
jgi:hypothetical protein